jgi:hypothetical protein
VKCGCGRVVVDDMELASGDCWECGRLLFDPYEEDDDEPVQRLCDGTCDTCNCSIWSGGEDE